MEENLKQLLFKDLCARLPYHVKVKVWLKDRTTEEGALDLGHNYGDVLQDAFYFGKIKDIKPYLRPMSSMTEEEESEYLDIVQNDGNWVNLLSQNLMDFFNRYHFDYRGLISMGLALEASEDMYNTKTE